MHITNGMINKELRLSGIIIKTFLPFFKEKRLNYVIRL
jgi:hypothetical protein